MNPKVINAFESAFLLLFILLLLYFVQQSRKQINFYSMWSTLLMCLGLSLRIILFATDLGIKIIGDDPTGVYSFKSTGLLFCKNVFVYMANCCFYFSFFAIGCDWIELCFAFKMLLKASPPEEFDPMRTRVKNFFVWFLIVFLVLLVLLLLSSVLTYIVKVTENNWIAFIALVCLTISQIILILMFVWLFISVLRVTLAIRKRQKEERKV